MVAKIAGVLKNIFRQTSPIKPPGFTITQMRNSTKLKILLQKYTISLDLDTDEQFKLILTDKATNEMEQFEGKSYSVVLSKAYSFLLKCLREQMH